MKPKNIRILILKKNYFNIEMRMYKYYMYVISYKIYMIMNASKIDYLLKVKSLCTRSFI